MAINMPNVIKTFGGDAPGFGGGFGSGWSGGLGFNTGFNMFGNTFMPNNLDLSAMNNMSNIDVTSQAADLAGNPGGNLGNMYYNGYGTRQDYTKAKEYYQYACDNDIGNACTQLGVMYARAEGVKQDFVKGKELSGKGCDKGSQTGCSNYVLFNKFLNSNKD